MKKKFLVGILVLIILFSITRVFAATSNSIEPRNTENTVGSNSTNELSEEDLIPALEEELREKQEQENRVSNDTENAINENTVNTTNTTNTTDSDNTTKNKTNRDNEDEILSDIYIAETENDLKYEDVTIDGNVYIVSTARVVFENSEILGNVFIISDSFEVNNTIIDGSSYIVADKINFIESEIKSIYAFANVIESDEETSIINDIRAVANTVNFLGEVGRESYIQVFETSNIEYSVTIQDILPEILTRFGIILVLAIIILGGFPKFVGVNLSLNISSFFKAFFTGILEIVIISAIALALMIWGFGIGYAFAILLLLGILLYFGKVIFIVAFALRLVKNRNRNARVKAFIFTIFVAAVVEAIELTMVLGETGFIVNLAINIILSITGFGTLFRVILTPKKNKKNEESKMPESTPAPVAAPQEEIEAINLRNFEDKKETTKNPTIEHNLNLQIENIDSEDSKPEVYEVTGKIIKRKISLEENTGNIAENEKNSKGNDEESSEKEDKE